MKLTPAQAAVLKRLQKYRVAAPALGERLRLAAGFMIALLLPVLLVGYLTVRLRLPGGLLLLAGLLMFSTGLLGEVLIRTYFETQDRRIYAVRQILAKKERRAAGR